MSWRTLIINRNSYCSIKDNHICIKKTNTEKEEVIKVALEEVKVVLLNSNIVTFSAPFFSRCLENKILIIHLNEKFLPCGYTTTYYNSINPFTNMSLQLNMTDPVKKRMWSKIVYWKCYNQIKLLEVLNFDVDIVQDYFEKIKNIKLGDKTNIEAYIAKEFFKQIYGKWFKRFGDDKINNCINFGYTIIASELSRILAAKGFVLPLGIFHRGPENTLNLTYDLIEPFRAFVDYYCFFNVLYNSTTNDLTIKEKYKVVSIIDELVEIDGRTMSVTEAMWIYVESIISSLKEENLDLIKFPILKDINNYWSKVGL